MPTLVHRVEELQQKGIGFRGLQEVIDTTSATDKLGFHAFSAMAEFERKLIRERTLAGLRAARAGADLHVSRWRHHRTSRSQGWGRGFARNGNAPR